MSLKAKPTPYYGPVKSPDTEDTSAGHKMFFRRAEEELAGEPALEGLTEEERSVIVEWCADVLITGTPDNAIHKEVWETDFIRKPVGIDEFVSNPYYFGKTCEDLYVQWRNDLRNVFAPGSTFSEWVMTGAIGIGKTSVAAAALGYKLYWLSCLRDPAKYYGLLPESKIVFGIYSLTLRQVNDTAYPKLMGYIDNSEYFRDQFPRDLTISSKIRFKKHNIEVVVGSQAVHATGLDLYGIILDEANFMKVKQDADTKAQIGQAYALYDATARRIESRFMTEGGLIPGLMILSSSRAAQTSFLEQRISQTAAEGNRSVRGLRGAVTDRVYLSDYALWDVKNYPGKRFKVVVGDRVRKTEILADGFDSPPGVEIIEVPRQFLPAFRLDPEAALRDIAGRATFSLSPLIKDRTSLTDAVAEGMEHPFLVQSITAGENDDFGIEQSFKLRTVCNIVGGNYRPKINPGAPRFMHLDLSLTGDSAGICLGHAAGIVKHQAQQPDGTFTYSNRLKVIIDFMLEIVPPMGSETDLSKIISFVLYLKRLYNIVLVTCDGWQSAYGLQLLRKQHIESAVLSVDRDDSAYVSLRGMLFDRYVAMYHYEPFQKQMLFLERNIDKHKVDHPEKFPDGTKGAKDVSDAVAGVVWHCLNDKRAFQGAALLDADAKPVPKQPSPVAVDPNTVPVAVAALPPSRQRVEPVKTLSPVVTAPSGAAFDWERLRENMKKAV